MFCRHCGADVADDSRFCSKCGKSLDPPPVVGLLASLRLNTPYPYAALLFFGFALWALDPLAPSTDYSQIRLELELRGESGYPDENIYRHHLSLIVENIGSEPVSEIPVEIRARVEPDQPAEIVSDFLGRQLVILENGESLPLIVILSDEVASGEKRRYSIDGIVRTMPPAGVTYEVLIEDTGQVLASFRAEIERPAEDGTPSGPIARLRSPRVHSP